MATITAALVKELRNATSAPMGDCKKALVESDGDLKLATEWLQKRSSAKVAKKAGRTAAEGLVATYVHHDGRTAVIAEVNSETDFVAKNAQFSGFVSDLCMHIAAMSPTYVSQDDVPADVVAKQREIAEHQVREMGKPEHLVPRIAEGKLKAWFGDHCLLDQPFVKDEKSRSVSTCLTELAATIGEKLVIRRFVRYELGEGIAKREDNFVDEVAKMAAN